MTVADNGLLSAWIQVSDTAHNVNSNLAIQWNERLFMKCTELFCIAAQDPSSRIHPMSCFLSTYLIPNAKKLERLWLFLVRLVSST
jgi:hypothetical protein